MAKKYVSRDPALVAVRLDVPAETRDRLRVLAAQDGKAMSEYVRDLVVREVEKKSPKK